MQLLRLQGIGKRTVVRLILLVVALFLSGTVLLRNNEKEPLPPNEVKAATDTLITEEAAASLTVVVNKKHKLPNSYVPELQAIPNGYLRPEAANALTKLLDAATSAGITLRIISSYRSYDTQAATYNQWVSQDGQPAADRYSARPGHSEHQTGLAVDFGTGQAECDLEICFGDTPAGTWLAAHAHKYGFIVRYGLGTEAVTGYMYEPWHIRYVGSNEAIQIKNSSKTMEEYYGIPGGDYQ